ncbi:MAG: hypothetical protein A3A24_01960 [Candidatus Buchananbacteria bacterium RIFCSPLOWO2_01_FULL_46_12]|uniref:Uncharacterized protein n=1 Tax=Candidatus Buchananbacteria bacterium RIFCSPLOWO2_01_FULL_46_12 TaxID=1797546 RepID=A0A1G1YSH3_9BACT|nr:MAG: hypothetical protein A3A24_01960 [Candidatus Buchananbacteria bacterium RIFCSPLOWO2_01_FULL_46_12]
MFERAFWWCWLLPAAAGGKSEGVVERGLASGGRGLLLPRFLSAPGLGDLGCAGNACWLVSGSSSREVEFAVGPMNWPALA